MAKIKGWHVEWKKGYATRYTGVGGRQIQVGLYRGKRLVADTKQAWHNKWYVDYISGGTYYSFKTRLFNTEKEAKAYAIKYMKTHTRG